MTDLDNALLYTEKLLAMNMPRENLAALRKVVAAARLVANPNIEAAARSMYRGLVKVNEPLPDYMLEEAENAVAAALTPGATRSHRMRSGGRMKLLVLDKDGPDVLKKVPSERRWLCAMTQTLWDGEWAGKCDGIYPEEPDHSLCRWVYIVDEVERAAAHTPGDTK